MKKFLILIIALFMQFCFVFADELSNNAILPSQKAIIKNVNYVEIPRGEETQIKQTADIRFLNGELKGEKAIVDNMLTGNPYYDIKLKKGMKVIIHVEKDEFGDYNFSIEDCHRSGMLIFLSILFSGLLIYVGKKKGIFSLLSIFLTCVLIYNFLSPMILAGFEPILATILICILSTMITMYTVGGFNKKSTSATLGCTLSIIFALILSMITVKFANLTGYTSENTMFLYTSHPELNIISIAVASMLLATLGAVMDVAMSIASTINEIFTIDNTKTVKELFKSGMNVGRDIIGTMANTLILVYLGGSLPLLLLVSNIDLQKFFNLNQVVTEIASALIGSCSIVICVPITALVAANLVRIKKSENIEKILD